MKAIASYASLEEFGRVRLSEHFFMREFLHSEIAAWHGLRNVPDDPDRAIAMGRRLCSELLEPLQSAFGRIHIRSGYRSPEVNEFGNQNRMNCASNQKNHGRHIWDHPDASGRYGAMACVVVPWLVDHIEKGGSWTAMAWWIHDHLPYGSLHFFPKLAAFNIGWHEAPERRIDSYAPPKGCLTRPGMANHSGSHADQYPGFPLPAQAATGHALPGETNPASPHARSPDKVAQRSSAAQAGPAPAATPVTGAAAGTKTRTSHRPSKPVSTPDRFASTGGTVRYRAVHTRNSWRRVNSHQSLESAINGPNGAAALFRGTVRVNYQRHGDPLFVLVWQDGAASGHVMKPDAASPGGMKRAAVPMDDLQRFEARGGASHVQLERYFK